MHHKKSRSFGGRQIRADSPIFHSRFSTSEQESNSVGYVSFRLLQHPIVDSAHQIKKIIQLCMDHPKIFSHKIYHRRVGLILVILNKIIHRITSSSLFPSHYIRDFFCLLGDDFSVSFFIKQILSQERFDPLYIGILHV